MNKEKILALADYMEALDPKRYNQGNWLAFRKKSDRKRKHGDSVLMDTIDPCRTNCCIAGHCTLMDGYTLKAETSIFSEPKTWQPYFSDEDGATIDPEEQATKTLDLDDNTARDLFSCTAFRFGWLPSLDVAVAVLRELAETGEVRWQTVRERILDAAIAKAKGERQ